MPVSGVLLASVGQATRKTLTFEVELCLKNNCMTSSRLHLDLKIKQEL